MKTSDKIVQASIALFNEHGERAITTNHIAEYLNMSPGNLYYHFKNKEAIIRRIFELYEEQLLTGLEVYKDSKVTVELLIGYLDAIFYTLWRFRFLYANLADIVNRDAELKSHYLSVQKKLTELATTILSQLVKDGFFDIKPQIFMPLIDTMKILISSWIGYQLVQSKTATIDKPVVYSGIIRVLMLLKPYTTPESKEVFEKTEEFYQSLVINH